jgi:hypothetical protein
MTGARPSDLPGPGDAYRADVHHASHEKLVAPVAGGAASASVDAVIVPTVRPAEFLRGSLLLAKSLNCPVLVLCSREADRTGAVAAAGAIGARATAVDVDRTALPVPLRAGAVAAVVAPDGRYVDLSLKRNIGLLVAQMLPGWKRVLFLDDDIVGVRPADVRAAASRVDGYTAIGLRIEGQPDNSVVCHAFRDTGGNQSTFIGGGAMVVPTDRPTSHFPDVYNEDWFFLLEGERLGRVGRTGASIQERYDPYGDPARARSEEFGDCLAEGIFALLDDGGTARDADMAYWHVYLGRRRRLIGDVMAKLPAVADEEKRKRMAAALQTAAATLAGIEARHCMEFLAAWRADRLRWSAYVAGLPVMATVPAALAHLGFTRVSQTPHHQE